MSGVYGVSERFCMSKIVMLNIIKAIKLFYA